jgi:folylpolyglutamate synthase/dihydropteroate synthase
MNNGAGEVNLFLDVGHNPSGLERLMRDLTLRYPNLDIHVMLAMSFGKSIRETCEVLARYANSVHCVSEDNGRLVSYNVLVNEMTNISPNKLSSSGSIHSVFPTLLPTLTPRDLLVICGSFYMMQDIKDLLSSHGVSL